MQNETRNLFQSAMTMWILSWIAVLLFSTKTFQFSASPRHRQQCNNAKTTLSMGLIPFDREGDRRRFLQNVLSSVAFLTAWDSIQAADARGLVTFPCTKPLGNTYHLMRSGQSLLEAEDVWSTNPLFLTNREAALSDRGIEEVEAACRQLKAENVNPTLVRYSLAASAIDTANIVGKELSIGRDRLVPEFNFMDPRSVGKWDTLPLSTTEAAVWALDADEAGPQGMGARPPANDDSTPHETLADQVVRLRQLISVLETQFSGDTILLVFPDGTGPALLSAMITGIPLNRAHELELRPSEVRLDVSMESTLALIASRPQEAKDEYNAVLQRGRSELRRLQNMSPDNVVSVKDQQLEQERVEMENELQRKANESKAREEATRAAQRERAMQVEAERRKHRDEIAAARQEQLSQMRLESGSKDKDVAIEESTANPMSIIVGSAGAALVGGLALSKDTQDDSTQAADTSTKTPSTPKEKKQDQVSVDTQSAESNADVGGTGAASSAPRLENAVGGVNGDDSSLGTDVTMGSIQVINGDRNKTPDPFSSTNQTIRPEFDDGTDSWLQSISEIIQEEDEEDS